jgi:aminoglycoside phosphotransferase (APT) family kinase protein
MIDGKWSIISDYIKGKTMDQLMKEDPSREKEFLDSFVSLQMEVHSKNCSRLASLKEKMKRKISQADLDATTRYDLHTRLEGMPRHERLCHGDFNPSNIIVTEDGRYCILDWAHATIGNASADVARTYLLFWLEGKMELAEAYLNLFCMKSGTSKQYVQKWMPIVAASQSVKGNEKEREFLLGWANVVEYE